MHIYINIHSDSCKHTYIYTYILINIHYGQLNKKCLPEAPVFEHVFPICDTAFGSSEVPYFKEMAQEKWPLRIQVPRYFQFALCFVLAIENVSSQLPPPITMPTTCSYASPETQSLMGFYLSGIRNQNKLFPL